MRPATSRAAASWRTPVGRAVLVAPDHAAVRVGRRLPHPARRERRAGSRAARGGRGPRARPAGRGPRAPGRRPSASGRGGRRPSRRPRSTRPPSGRCAAAARTHARDQLVDRVRVLELDPAPAPAPPRRGGGGSRSGPGRAASSGASSMTRVPGSGRGLDVATRPRRHDPPVARSPMASTQPGPVVTGEGRDPAPDDEGRARHGWLRSSGGIDDRVVVGRSRPSRRRLGRRRAPTPRHRRRRRSPSGRRAARPRPRPSGRPAVPRPRGRPATRPRPGPGPAGVFGPFASPSSPPAAGGRAG